MASMGWGSRWVLVGLGVLLTVGCGAPAATSNVDDASSPDISAVAPLPAQADAPTPEAPEAPAPPVAQAPPAASGALAVLATLLVKGRAPKTDYSREQFGQEWADVERNGCDTRSDVLMATLVNITSSGACTVTSGTLNDPYTATAIQYVRGGASEVDIDHVVALSNAWQTGAFGFPFAKRVALANDPLNLLAVQASANRQKGDGDAATWLPANKAFRCDYVARQIAVKAKYELWVTAPEAEVMKAILGACPGQVLPAPGAQPTLASNTGSVPEGNNTQPRAAPPPPGGAQAPGAVTYYRVCADARAAGVTPLRAGTAVYDANTHLDRDKDGIACE